MDLLSDNLQRARLKANEHRVFLLKLASGIGASLVVLGSFSNLYYEQLPYHLQALTAFYLMYRLNLPYYLGFSAAWLCS